MDKQSLHETAKRLALELPFVELCWPFGPDSPPEKTVCLQKQPALNKKPRITGH